MAEHYLEQIPELYFMKTEIAASIRKGEARLSEIALTEKVCLGTLLSMILMRKEEMEDALEQAKLEEMGEIILDLYQKYGFEREAYVSLLEDYKSGKLLSFYQ